jgi:hypothetical protein
MSFESSNDKTGDKEEELINIPSEKEIENQALEASKKEESFDDITEGSNNEQIEQSPKEHIENEKMISSDDIEKKEEQEKIEELMSQRIQIVKDLSHLTEETLMTIKNYSIAQNNKSLNEGDRYGYKEVIKNKLLKIIEQQERLVDIDFEAVKKIDLMGGVIGKNKEEQEIKRGGLKESIFDSETEIKTIINSGLIEILNKYNLPELTKIIIPK